MGGDEGGGGSNYAISLSTIFAKYLHRHRLYTNLDSLSGFVVERGVGEERRGMGQRGYTNRYFDLCNCYIFVHK